MPEYPKVRIWQDALAIHPEDDDEIFRARERLRHAYEQFRERAQILANEIRRDLPDLTVHDITHSDALWEMADIIAGPNISLTPTEAFVLGGAFLIHDLGLGVAAYPEGVKSLKDQLIWQDTYAALMIQKQGHYINPEKDTSINEEIEKLATEQTLRELHAKHAEKLALISWDNQERDQKYYLINDDGLRVTYGESIGRVAHSHWLAVSDLKEEFGIEPLGAPSWAPNHWKVDLLKLACLLRVADASHIDARRAPDFLRVLQKPKSPSKEHWIFQGRLLQPQLDGDYLTFTSGLSFSIEEVQAWWLCLDTLRKLDHELRLVDALITESKPRFNRFAAHGVAAVEDPMQLRNCIPTKDWIPIDTEIRVTDVASLVQKLGGDELYGHKPMVPLRELIQNAIDAIRARRIKRQLPSNWGEIYIRLGEDSSGYWIEVEDNGIGMSTDLLTGPLLDFGKSYWGSALMRKELPGLLSAGFKSIGKYGIGFFSVFMWGEHVRVTSRRYNAADKDTKVLEFIEGLTSRPILRDAKEEEFIFEGGTRVRVWLKQSPYDQGGLLKPGEHATTLIELCAYLCPASDVNINVETTNEDHKRVISASDWITVDGRELLSRTELIKRNSNDETAIEALSSNLRLLSNPSGDIVGRACISPWGAMYDIDSIPEFFSSVTVGGLYASHMTNIAGLLTGLPIRATRDQAYPLVEADILANWASDQAELAKNIADTPEELAAFAWVVISCGGSANNLPVALGQRGWMSIIEIAEWKDIPDEILIMEFVSWRFEKEKYEKLLLNKQVLVTRIESPIILQGPDVDRFNHERWPRQLVSKTFEKEIIKALAQAWSSKFDDVLQEFKSRQHQYILREIGTNNEIPVKEQVQVIRRPNLNE